MRFSKLLNSSVVFWFGIIFLYLIVRLPALTNLPLFADEAIYLRWSQLIITDWQQYLFFPLNDGKTPLFIWMLVPFVQLIVDPLWAGRILSVLGGLVQIILVIHILKEIKVHRIGQLVGALIVIFAPFWFFHHRMVLMDCWMTVWLSLATLAVLKVSDQSVNRRQFLIWVSVGIVAVWAGLMTKIPFLLALPALLLLPLRQHENASTRRWQYRNVVLVLFGGSVLALLLGFSPVFPQLLSRGGDFLLPISEVLAGRWRETVPSIPNYLSYFVSYSGWGVAMLALLGLFLPGKRRVALIMAGSFVLFSSPIWLLGRVVFPRYLFPAMLYLTLLASIGAGTLWQWSVQRVHTTRRRVAIRLLLILLVVQLLVTSARFVIPSWFSVNDIPFVSADQGQYLTTWSSGHGLKETYEYLQQLDKVRTSGSIIVATEGNFGSLPDGLLLYNFHQPLEHVWIEGIGYPVTNIPQVFVDRYREGDQVLLVVNSDRMQWQMPLEKQLKQFPRPNPQDCAFNWNPTVCMTFVVDDNGSPSLDVWDITDMVRDLKSTNKD